MTKKKTKKNNIGKVTIPKKYKTDTAKLNYLTETIEKKCSNVATTKGKATAFKIQIGQYLIALKLLLKVSAQ